jgi:hypothetical protein
MNIQTNNDVVLAKKQNIEDYYSTILALLAFISLTTWENGGRKPGSEYGFGRKMETSDKNKISPCVKVTPDSVVQQTTDSGYIVEAKKSLPMDKDGWEKCVRQLLKYDDNLLGWWTDNSLIRDQYIVLLIEISRSVEFCDYIRQYLQSNPQITVDKPFSVVEFGRADEMSQYYLLRTRFGEIGDNELKESLRKGKKVSSEAMLGTYGQKKFYDTEPEVEFTMEVIWDHILPEMATKVIFDKNLNAYVFEVNVSTVTKELQNNYGFTGNLPREVELPKKSWVRKAFDGFTRIGLMEYIDSDRYRVSYKKIRGDCLERFIKLLYKKNKSLRIGDQEKAKQLALFDEKKPDVEMDST